MFGVVVLLGAIDLVCYYFLQNPSSIPSGPVLHAMRKVYWNSKSFIQYNADCAQFDSRLAYRLRPGSCQFSGAGFSNKFSMNNQGLRDDEASLAAPEVIVLGDSQAMGWSVGQNETFAAIIEAKTNITVLNAAVSSYATAREVLSLDRLDTSNLKTLVIQYCDNDIEENGKFYNDNYQLNTMSQVEYDDITASHERLQHYRPGRHIAAGYTVAKELYPDFKWKVLYPMVMGFMGRPVQVKPTETQELDYGKIFLDILLQSKINLSDIQIIVFEVNNYGRGTERNKFISRLIRAQKADPMVYSELNIELIDVHDLLATNDYYRLDGHLTVSGHRQIADAIISKLALRDGSL